jgi:GT2 family glycosyltransferase
MADIFHLQRPRLAISIVSHGHGALVQALLLQLAQISARSVARVVLVQNLPESSPEAPLEGWPFELKVVVNDTPKGFGANHNFALRGADEEFVCILNPDVALQAADPFPELLVASSLPGVGCAYPIQVDDEGRVQDSEREIPSPAALLRRRLLGQIETRADWVNAACIVVPTPVWHQLGGFDERYFMYCEDVDWCLRVRLRGLQLVRAPVCVVHTGQRASGRSARHLAWHVRSLLRLWISPVYCQAQQLLTSASSSAGTIGTP